MISLTQKCDHEKTKKKEIFGGKKTKIFGVPLNEKILCPSAVIMTTTRRTKRRNERPRN